MNWGRGRTPPIFMASPFHRFGVKIKTKGETKRDRRITPDEERRLLEAADKLNCAEHAFAGAQMRDRIVGALETACRLGEMLKIQNRHVLWDTHQIIIPAEHAKDAESRRIPFEPKGRLAQILKRRRFLGPKGYVFGGSAGEYQGTIRTAWESLVLLAHGIEPTRTRAHGRVNREQLAEIDLHWHDLRHEAACRWLAKGLDLARDSAPARSRRPQDDAAVPERDGRGIAEDDAAEALEPQVGSPRSTPHSRTMDFPAILRHCPDNGDTAVSEFVDEPRG